MWASSLPTSLEHHTHCAKQPGGESWHENIFVFLWLWSPTPYKDNNQELLDWSFKMLGNAQNSFIHLFGFLSSTSWANQDHVQTWVSSDWHLLRSFMGLPCCSLGFFKRWTKKEVDKTMKLLQKSQRLLLPTVLQLRLLAWRRWLWCSQYLHGWRVTWRRPSSSWPATIQIWPSSFVIWKFVCFVHDWFCAKAKFVVFNISSQQALHLMHLMSSKAKGPFLDLWPSWILLVGVDNDGQLRASDRNRAHEIIDPETSQSIGIVNCLFGRLLWILMSIVVTGLASQVSIIQDNVPLLSPLNVWKLYFKQSRTYFKLIMIGTFASFANSSSCSVIDTSLQAWSN